MKKLILISFIFLAVPLRLLAQENFNIKMTTAGFDPKELTIQQGDSVTFTSADGESHWPASNFHPTHLIYPEFDPKMGIKPGQSWTFKFDKAGSWGMHDHLFPRLTGTITVQKSTTSAEMVVSHPSFWARIVNFFHKLFKR